MSKFYSLFCLSAIVLWGCGSGKPGEAIVQDSTAVGDSVIVIDEVTPDVRTNSDKNFLHFALDGSAIEEAGEIFLEENAVDWVLLEGTDKRAPHFSGDSSFMAMEIESDHADATYTMWVKSDRFQPNTTIFSFGNGCSAGYGLLLDDQNRLTLLCGGVDVNITKSDYVFPDNEWVHIGLVKRRNDFTIYINGVPQSSGSSGYNSPVSDESEMTVGAGRGCNNPDPRGGYFAGQIRDLYVFEWAYGDPEMRGLAER